MSESDTVVLQPAASLGPTFASIFIQAFEVGLIMTQHSTFWKRTTHKGRVTGSLLLFSSLVGLVQMVLTVRDAWVIMVIKFGDWDALLVAGLSSKLSGLLTTIIAVPIQSYFSWRCWMLTGKRVALLVLLGSLILGYVVTSVLATVDLFQHVVNASRVSQSPKFILAQAFPAVLNLILTVILSLNLDKLRANVKPRFQMVVVYFIIMIWQTALPPCLCATTALFTHMLLRKTNFWCPALQAILGKLYLISFLAILNGHVFLPDLDTNAIGAGCSEKPGADLESRQRRNATLYSLKFAPIEQVGAGVKTGDLTEDSFRTIMTVPNSVSYTSI